jgi:hypothetical protein
MQLANYFQLPFNYSVIFFELPEDKMFYELTSSLTSSADFQRSHLALFRGRNIKLYFTNPEHKTIQGTMPKEEENNKK